MRILFVHGYAGRLEDARAKSILSRDLELYEEFLRQGIEPVVATLDVHECPEMVSAGIAHVPLAMVEGGGGLMNARRALRALVGSQPFSGVVADVTAAPLMLGSRWPVPVLCRYEWYWSRVARIEDGVLERRLKSVLERRLIRTSAGVLASTQALAKDALDKGAKKAWLFPVFVAREFFETSRCMDDTAERKYRFLCVGRHVAVKRFDVAVSALSHLSFLSEIQMEIVGAGPETCRIRDLAQESGVRLVEHGSVANDCLPEVFARATALLHPSLNEGMPRVILEAMACGLPVFAGHSLGSEEVIGADGARGTLVGDSASDWSEAIESAFESGAFDSVDTDSVKRGERWARENVSVSACVRACIAALVEATG